MGRHFGLNRVWFFCTLVLNWVCCLEETTFSSLSIRPETKALQNLCFGQLCQPQRYQIFGLVMNRVGNRRFQSQIE